MGCDPQVFSSFKMPTAVLCSSLKEEGGESAKMSLLRLNPSTTLSGFPSSDRWGARRFPWVSLSTYPLPEWKKDGGKISLNLPEMLHCEPHSLNEGEVRRP